MFLHLITAGFTLVLVAGQNSPPRLQGSCNKQVLENATIGTVLLTLVIVDDGPRPLPIIEVFSETSKLVNVSNIRADQTSGFKLADVILIKELDRDSNPAQRDLIFTIFDGELRTTVKCPLYIIDVNDEPPKFQNIPYRVTINESQPIDTSVYEVLAEDNENGLGGLVFYSMTAHAQDADDVYNTTFEVDRVSGQITLKRPLDYEKRYYYQFHVIAEDGLGLRADPQQLAILVEDVQDSPPEFVRLPYMAPVSENAGPGTSVITVTAYDGDRGVPNAVTYSFVNDTYGKFEINATTGVVTVRDTLDADDPDVRARGGLYVMTVLASEVTTEPVSNLTSTTASVSITVTDENDEVPAFSQTFYNGSVLENSPRGSPITLSVPMVVEDRDQGANSRFRLSVLQGGQLFNGFTTLPDAEVDITGKTSVILVVGDFSLLDFEQRQSLTFTVMANETDPSSHFNSTLVTVDIIDINDNAPVFPPQVTSFNVSEDSRSGEVIGAVTATDADSGAFGRVSYSLEDAQTLPFDVNASDGAIMVSGQLDREVKVSYTLFIVATDTPGGETSQQRSQRQRVDVTLVDVNDNDPTFIGPSPQAFIAEDIAVNTTVVALSATDADAGENGHVTFSLDTSSGPQPLFDVRDGPVAQSGVLLVSSSLIDHTGKHEVTVLACDGGTPRRCANRTVEVFVRDVNLNTPQFVSPNVSASNLTAGILPTITVTEEQPIRTKLYRLQATDADDGLNGNVTYFLDPDPAQDWQAFEVDRVSGWLSNSRRLDRETKDSYQIQVSAKDQGNPQLVSSVTMRVILKDIDDNPPSFRHLQPMPKTLSVEEERQNVSVDVNLARDADSDPENNIICYFLHGGEMLDHFRLNATSGELYVIKPLDRETRAKVNLVIQALGNCTADLGNAVSVPSNGGSGVSNTGQPPPGYNASDDSLLWLQLDVKDINDHPPVFNEKFPVHGVLSDAAVGDEVYNLRDIVTDADVGENAVTYFRLTGPVLPSNEVSGDPVRLRTAFNVTRNGSVVVNMLFTAKTLGHFTLPLLAFNDAADGRKLNDTAQLKMFIISDIQRVRLTFRKVPDEVKRLQEALIRKMQEILQLRIVVDKIASHQDLVGNVDESRTDMFIHARRLDTGEVVPASELARSFDFNQQLNVIFAESGVVEAVPVLQQTSTEGPEVPIRNAFIIVALALFLLVVTLVAVLINLRSRYHRKLRAATIKTPTYHKTDELQPGTNMFVEAASNPLYNKKIRLIEEDTNSQNSLDDNEVRGRGDEEDEEVDEQEMQIQFNDEDRVFENRQSSNLASVLNIYDSIKAKDPAHTPDPAPSTDPVLPGQEVGRVNPAFEDNDVIPNGDARKMSLNVQSLEHTDL